MRPDCEMESDNNAPPGFSVTVTSPSPEKQLAGDGCASGPLIAAADMAGDVDGRVLFGTGGTRTAVEDGKLDDAGGAGASLPE